MKTFSKKILSVVIVIVMLASAIPFTASAANGTPGDYEVEIRGANVLIETRDGAVFDGYAFYDDVLEVTANEAQGRTFDYWKSADGDVIPDAEFRIFIHKNTYIAPHYTDTDEYEFGEWETYRQSDDCEVPTVMIRENALGDVEFKEVYTNYGHHSFGEWQPDNSSQQGHFSTCRICGKEVYEDHDWYDLEVISEPTHDEPGIVRRICAVCSFEYDFELEATEEHKWGDYTVTVPADGSGLGQRTRSCVWCGASENVWYLDPDLEELWKDHYMSFYFSTRYGGSREERYYSYTQPDGSVVYVFAMQLTTTNARDYDQTFIFMYTDDGDPTTKEPVYLTKSGSSSSSMMGQFRWAPYDYVSDFAGFAEVVGHPDGVNVPGITQGNNMGGRGATLTWRYDDWAEEINGRNIPTTVDPADIPGHIWYEVEATDVELAKTNVYDDGGALVSSGGGFDGCTTYRKEVSPGQYDYMTVDPVTGAVVRKIESVSNTTSYFKEYRDIVSPEAYALLPDSEKAGAVSSGDVASLVSQFASGRIGIANLTLDVPSPYTAVRVQVDRSVYRSDFDVSGKNWDYNCYSSNVAGVHRTVISGDYPNEYALTFEWNEDNENHDVFDRWEMWNFAAGAWETLSTDPTMVLNTYSAPLTDLTVIRPVYHRDETECLVRVGNGWFCIDGEGDTPHNEEHVPIGTRIYLVEEDKLGEGLSFVNFEDSNTSCTYEHYSTFSVGGDINVHAVYEQFRCIVNIETYCWDGGFVYFADEPVQGEMWAQSSGDVCYGDTVTVCTVPDTENGYTDADWLGWYRVVYDDFGNEQWVLLSTDMTADIEITQDGMIEAVWNNGNVPFADKDEPLDISEWIRAAAQSGFVAVRQYDDGGEYGASEDGGLTIRQNSYSALLVPGWSELALYDDPTDNLTLTEWSATYVEAETEEEITDTFEAYEGECAYYCVNDYEYYLTAEIAFAGGGVEGHEHVWNGGVTTEEPTYTSEGVRTYTCTVCGETYTETIPKLISDIPGDANGDGLVNVRDLSDLKKHMAQTALLDADGKTRADLNGDGLVNFQDLGLLKKRLAA